ncbi:MAG: DUF386 domain-containing protein [Phycisphaerae bacterium]|nr:DUF386 domain-containing protein [Phycisphaerae bacterium]
MIIDRIDNASLYYGLMTRIGAGLRWLQKTNLETIQPGKHNIDGANLYAVVAEYQTKPVAQGFWEAHRRYIDIQYVADGVERIGYANLDDLREVEPYDEEKDFLKLQGAGDLFVVRPRTFVIFGPQDAHMPGISVDEPQAVRKVVVKVLIDSAV